MKLIGTELGRVVHLLVPEEVRPTRGQDVPALLTRTADRYGFAKFPTTPDAFSQSAGLKFEHGRLISSVVGGEIAIPEFSVFNDGVIAVCGDTALAELLIDDFIDWLVETETIRRPVTIKPRAYTSHVIVQFDRLSSSKLDDIFKTSARFDAELSAQYDWGFPTTLGRISISSTDPYRLLPHRIATFVIERRANVPYDQNWFWSSAPLPLPSHLRLLEGAEEDLLRI